MDWILCISPGIVLGVLFLGARMAGAQEPGAWLDGVADLAQGATPEGRLIYVNAAWRKSLGYAEAVGELCAFDLVHPDYRDEYRSLMRRVLAGEPQVRFETVLLTRDGRSLSVEGSCTACGEPAVLVNIFRDVTDRKRAEEVLSRQAGELFQVNRMLEDKDRAFAETMEQARKYREAQARAAELSKINEELKAEIRRRTEAEAQIRASLREKEILLKEIHHRVKNNLQIISSLLNLQAEQMGGESLPALFRESQDRIQTMALIHEKLYRSGDLARVDFAEYLHSLTGYLMRSYGEPSGRIALNVEAEDVFWGIDTAIPCGLMVNELVSNALKHAFPAGKAGEIYVRLAAGQDGMCRLVVGDTGIGLPEALDSPETGTLGLQLVHTLAEQLEGFLELDRSRGTEFRVTFRA